MKKLLYSQAVFALLLSAALPAKVSAANVGDLIVCPDFSSVYYLAEDGQRHVFPNEQIFYSWYTDFHDVVVISCDDLANIPLGDSVVYQAGTRLVKLPSAPTVYVVEDDGVLRALSSEEQAAALFGDDWAHRIDDLSEAFWSKFTVGEPLADGEIPNGTIVQDEQGELFRVQDGEAVQIDVVLDTDQEDNLESHALDLDDIEERLGVALALTRVDAAQAATVLADILEKLQAVDVDLEDEVELDEIDELDDDDIEDAEDAIADAEEEIAEALEDINEDREDGKDVAAAEVLLTQAQEQLAQAQVAFDEGDYPVAEDYADGAKHSAMWARGKAVDSIDDDSDEEGEDEDLGEDENTDEGEAENEDDDEDDSNDESENQEDEGDEDREVDDLADDDSE